MGLTKKELDWLATHPDIESGVMQAWPPMTFIGTDKEPKGVSVDFVEKLNQRLGGRLRLRSGRFPELLTAAKEKRLPVLTNLTPYPSRKAYFHFTEPYLSIPHVIVARKGDFYARKIDDLRGRRVAVEQGVVEAQILSEHYPELLLRFYPNTSDALDAVVKGEADAYIGNRAVALYILEQELITNLQVQGKLGDLAELAFGVRSDWPMLQSILQKALASISQAERHDILKHWVPTLDEPSEKTLEETAKLSLTGKERIWLEAHPSLRLGVDTGFEPIDYLTPQGEHQGIAAEFMGRIQRMLGIKMKPQTDLTWYEVLEKAKVGEVDVIPAISPSDQRGEFLKFTQSYHNAPLMIFSRHSAPLIDGLADLAQARVVVEHGYITQEYLEQDYPHIELLLVDSPSQALQAVASGQADAYVGYLSIGSHLIDKLGLTNLKVSAPTEYKTPMAIGVRKDWPELPAILDKALATFNENERRAIRQSAFATRYDMKIDYTSLWQVVFIAGILLLVSWLWLAQTRRQKSALATAKAEAEQANRFKSTFLANMNHEIRTPMNAIMGFSHLTLQTELNQRQHQYVENIHRSSCNMLDVINHFLDISRIEAGKLEIEHAPFALDEVLDNLSSMTGAKAEEKGLEFLISRALDVPNHLIGDPLHLGHVLINLIDNAIKFTDHGEISLRVAMKQRTAEYIKLRFEVRDTGIGIAPDQIERLFQAFIQLDNSTTRRYGGSDLGLSISQYLMRLMGGEIEAQSAVGVGSLFHFTLPFSLSKKSLPEELDVDPSLLGMRVLVVDDNASAREILRERLVSFNFEVSEAQSAAEAMERLRQADQAKHRPYTHPSDYLSDRLWA
jgi:polar amino acid transport system substrate-binding protein